METTETVAEPQARNTSATFDAFRRWGYLEADLDPLGRDHPAPHPELDLPGEEAERARRIYCGSIGVEFMHIADPERRRWVRERMEAPPSEVDRHGILDRLLRAEIFEQVLQSRYLGTKRFSLEGVTALLPFLDHALEGVGRHEAEMVVLAMSHRGRLNVMAHIVGTPAAALFAGFEDVDPRSILGGGDVKYHLGATGNYETRDGRKIRIHLVSNPSHLEAVNPVAMGRVRAKQRHRGDTGHHLVVPIILHGDAAFAGQGIAAESLNLADLDGFSVGGALQVVVNNRIGFTAQPAALHSGSFATDVAKRLPVPIFHVNGEDLEAVVRVAEMAVEFRYTFGTDVVVDLIGYRRHGHSEIDDPTITQPLLYKKIGEHPPLWKIWADRIGVAEEETDERIAAIKEELDQAQKLGEGMTSKPKLAQMPSYWDSFKGGYWKPEYEVDTGVAAAELGEIAAALTRCPEGFHVHPKVAKLLEQRAEMGRGERPVDFGMAEALAFGSLLKQGVPVRLSGQDSRRGTFNQRHAVLVDTEDESEHAPLATLAAGDAFFEIYDSMLSEAAVLGFEYGFSRDYPEALVAWEAQFGDFANGGQVIIDQFISAAEDKWGLLSGLVMLLPHAFEGQGPEHSSARLERYLQLAAEDNLQVAQPSTAAQYFHLLRRQILRRWHKPLVVLTPKGMLRHKDSASSLGELSRPRFHTVVADPDVEQARTILFCSGKIGHELKRERQKRQDTSTAVVFLDQLYPFPEQEVATELERYADARTVVWVQEEPANMGALSFVLPRLERLARGRTVRSVKRSASASPATGSAKAHHLEQKTLVTLPFELGARR